MYNTKKTYSLTVLCNISLANIACPKKKLYFQDQLVDPPTLPSCFKARCATILLQSGYAMSLYIKMMVQNRSWNTLSLPYLKLSFTYAFRHFIVAGFCIWYILRFFLIVTGLFLQIYFNSLFHVYILIIMLAYAPASCSRPFHMTIRVLLSFVSMLLSIRQRKAFREAYCMSIASFLWYKAI